jgi:hypothetical protein
MAQTTVGGSTPKDMKAETVMPVRCGVLPVAMMFTAAGCKRINCLKA